MRPDDGRGLLLLLFILLSILIILLILILIFLILGYFSFARHWFALGFWPSFS